AAEVIVPYLPVITCSELQQKTGTRLSIEDLCPKCDD
ncbi:unnamed protein product, partial [marine sediment metagenome]